MLIGFADEQLCKLNVKKDNFEERVFTAVTDSVKSIIPVDEFKECFEKGKVADFDMIMNVIDPGAQN